jgi:glycerophosphoryl diester phosphodiesterase
MSVRETKSKRRTENIIGTAGAAAGAYLAYRHFARPVKPHPFLQQQGLIVMAHRGGGGRWPHNTLYAFERAAALRVDVLELDIHMTRDGVLVVMHDSTVENTTDGSGAIRSMNLKELKALDAGYQWTDDGGASFPFRNKGIQVPTLQEILEAFPGLRLNIDIKPQAPGIVEPFVRLLSDYRKLEKVMVGSFHDEQLRRFRRLSPATATAAGVQETRLFYAVNRVRLAAIYSPAAQAFQVPEWAEGRQIVTRRFIKNAQRHRIQVHVWTVDEIEDMQRLIEWGADGLITDYPDRLVILTGRT